MGSCQITWVSTKSRTTSWQACNQHHQAFKQALPHSGTLNWRQDLRNSLGEQDEEFILGVIVQPSK